MALILITFFLKEQSLSWSNAFGFRNAPANRGLALGLVAGIVIVPVAWFLQHISSVALQWFDFNPQSQEIVKTFQETVTKASMSGALVRQQIAFGVSVVLIAPIAEEMLFRGILYPTLKQLGHPRIGLWGTSLLFALLHNNGPSFFPFVCLALLLVWLYEKTDNLLACIVAHSFFNGANFLYLLYEQPVNRFLGRFI